MKIIEKVALSLLLPALMMINVYGEETSTATTVESCSTPPTCPPDPATCCKESTKAEPATTETTTKEEPATQETTTTEETFKEGLITQKITIEKVTTEKTTTIETYLCPFPKRCPPPPGVSSSCCSKTVPQEKPSIE